MNLPRLAELEVDEYLAATKGVPMKDLFKGQADSRLQVSCVNKVP